MNREIKFRYRLKLVSDDWGRYKEGDIDTFYFSLNDKKTGLYRFAIDERWDIVSCDQYTELKDKKGVEAYHSDIVEHKYLGIGFIDWDKDNASFFLNFGGYDWNTIIRDLENCKIIGNIHENPELLK